MTYTLIFAGMAVLLVVAVVVRQTRKKPGRGDSVAPRGTAGASRTPSGSAARRERKRRRHQSRDTRRKRH